MAIINVMLGDQSLGSHTISHTPFIVGRDPTCDARIDNIALSRHHCQFTWADGAFRIEDLKSANGTFLNGERIESAQVKDGDEIRLGKFKLVFHQAPGEPAPPPRGDQPTSLAEMLGAAVEPQEARPQVADSMKTFQMSADLIRAQVGTGPSVKGARAAEVARSMGEKGEAGPPARTVLYVVIAVNALVILALVAVVIVLLTRK